jgi:LAO/AO transport system kinase
MEDFDARRPAALARAVSIVENQRPGADTLLATLHPRINRARRIGLTGPPGAGKSTVTMHMAKRYRDAGLTVGIVAVDPTSPFTGGALLGDRVRMEAIALDPGVFIRSMATRGSLGGLSSATRDVCDVLDAFGFDRILIETVGVGQSELEIAHTADSSVVILVPESGDSIQTLKAGLMEIADLFVVNKCDRPGGERLIHELELMLGLRAGHALTGIPAHHGVELKAANPARQARELAAESNGAMWMPPALKMVAKDGTGIPELIDALDRHFVYLEASGALRDRRRQRLRDRVRDAVDRRVRLRVWGDPATETWVTGQIAALEAGMVAPLAVADELLARSAPLLRGQTGAE